MITRRSYCPNLNHGRRNAPVRFCPMCGEVQMKTSPSRRVPKRNTQKADLKETSIVWIVANSLSKEYDSNEPRGRDAKHG